MTSCTNYSFNKELRNSIQSLRDLPSDQQVFNFSNFTKEGNWSYLLILQTDESVPLEAYNGFGEINNYFGFDIENMSTNKMRFYLLNDDKNRLRHFRLEKRSKTLNISILNPVLIHYGMGKCIIETKQILKCHLIHRIWERVQHT